MIINLLTVELKYNDQDLLQEILRIQKIINNTPTQSDIEKYSKYPIGAFKRHFKTYNNALKKLNISTNIQFNTDNEEIKNDIIRISKLLGRAPPNIKRIR